MAISSAVEIYDNTKGKPTDLEGILKDSDDVKDVANMFDNITDLTKETKDKEEPYINKLAEDDYDKRVLDHEKDIKNYYSGGLDDQEKQTIRDDFKKYLHENGTLAAYLDNPESSLGKEKKAEIKKVVDEITFEIHVFKREVEDYFTKTPNGGTGANTTNPDAPRAEADKAAVEAYKNLDKPANTSAEYTTRSYRAEDVNEEEDNVDNDDDKKALKIILKGKKEQLDLIEQDYRPTGDDRAKTRMLMRVLLRIGKSKPTNQDIETKNIITTLQRVMKQYHNDGKKFDLGKGWRKRAGTTSEARDEYKLGALYQLAVEDTAGYPYLKKVMDLLVKEFAGVDTKDTKNKVKDFSDIYNEHNDRPTDKELNLKTKKGEAIRAIENADAKDRRKIRKLLNLAEDVDPSFLTAIADEIPKISGGFNYVLTGSGIGKELTNKEKRFIKLCNEGTSKKQDPNAFDYVLGGLLSGMTIQELANAQNKALDIPTEGTEKQHEDWFIEKFADTDFNGYVGFDENNMVKGLEFIDIYQRTKELLDYQKKPNNLPLVNIIQFGRHLADKLGQPQFVKAIDDFIKAKPNPTFREMNIFFNDHKNIPLLSFLQESVLTSPVPINNILQFGTDAYKEFYKDSLILPENASTLIKNRVEELLKAKGYDLNDIAGSTANKEGIVQAVTGFVMTEQSGAGIGTSINIGALADPSNPLLATLLNNLSINLGIGVANSSDDVQTGVVGLNLAWNKSFRITDNTVAFGGVSTGVSLAAGFIPMRNMSVGGGFEQLINGKKIQKQLDVTGAKKISLSANATLIYCAIPSRGVNFTFGNDKIEGIDIQYKYIQEKASEIGIACLDAINKATIFGDQVKSIEAIKKVFRDKFPGSSNEEMYRAAFNIYKGLQTFNLTLNDITNEKKNSGRRLQVAEMLGDYYALAWRNAAVTGLHGRSFSDANIGVQFFAGFMPIPNVGLHFANYDNRYYQTTAKSEAQAQKAEVIGDGNRLLSKTIGQAEVDFINESIDIPYQEKKAAIKETDKENPDQAPNILFDTDNNTIKIPFDLREKSFININLDPCLKKKIAKETDKDGKEYLVVPANIPMRLFTESRGNDVITVLNLGDVKSDGNNPKDKDKNNKDLNLGGGINKQINKSSDRNNNERLAKNASPAFEQVTTAVDINKSIKELNNGDYKDFPLASAAKSTVEGNTQQTIFTLKTPVLPVGTTYYVDPLNSGDISLDKNNNTLTLVPDVGELTVNYEKENKRYVFSYKKETATEKILRISYQINSLTAANADESNRSTKEHLLTFTDGSPLFEFADGTEIAKAEKIISDNLKQLKNAEKGHHDDYEGFMDDLRKIQDTNDISETEINNAMIHLTKILGAENELIKHINTNKNDYKVVAYIVDRMKQIFAMENYTGTLSQLWLPTKQGGRGKAYKELLSSSNKTLPASIDRETLLTGKGGDRNETFNAEKNAKADPNLIGYTAFYRKNLSRAWSMTAPGNTTVYDNFISDPLTKESLKDGQKWFCDNLDAQKYEKELLLAAIQTKIPEKYQFQIQPEDVIKFLRTGELIVTIDKGTEIGTKYKLTLNADYHFYLLGECANESLGIKIGGIDIQKFTPKGGDNSSRDITHGYENPNIGLYVNTVYTKNQAEANKIRRGGTAAAGVATPKEMDAPKDTFVSNPILDANGIPDKVTSEPGIIGEP